MDAGQPGPMMWREAGDKRPSLAVHMPMPGMRAPSLVREGPPRCGATEPRRHNCCALGPGSRK